MKAFLDACVLFPPIMRRMLIAVAEAGEITPLWSARVFEEWLYSVRQKLGPAEAALAEGEIALLRARWPAATIPPQPEAEAALTLPDPHDAHVLACAVAGGADLLVTLNLRDFPPRKLRDFGVTPIHPDALLWEIFGRAPETVTEAALRAVSAFSDADGPPHALIKRGGMPRLAKALKRADG
jgi:predicted nucleic acid-binding protein